jgi:hypothetical protein
MKAASQKGRTMRPLSRMAASSKSPLQASVALAVGLCGLVVSACNGPASSLTPVGATPMRSQAIKPLAGGSATPSPIPFVFQTVDNPNSNQNQVTAINQLGKIVGTFGGGQGSNIYESYTSQRPYDQFRGLNYPGAQGTVTTSLSSNKIQAGYVMDPNSLTGIWGFVRVSGLWTLLDDPNEGPGNYAVTEILGINDSEFAVGYYVNASGIDVPYELSVPTQTFANLQPPGAIQAEATGINGKGDISGFETTSSVTEGFFLKAGTYYPFSYPGAVATYALSLNWSDQIVGYYIDASGAKHGFVLTGPTKGGSQQTWQSVDEPNAAAGTWITGINNHHDICGYYIDANGAQHGFAAVP